MKKSTFGSMALAILFFWGCKDEGQQPNQLGKPAKVSLRQEWFPNANYAGELFAVYETGRQHGLEIALEAGSDQIDPIKLVLSGQNDFGVVSADRILAANETGADLVVIGVANSRSPTCFISKADLNIKRPSDFRSRRVGILSGTNTELVYKILKLKEGLHDDHIREIEVPFDLATFINGEYDVRPAFVYDEPVSLDRKGIRYNMVKPEDFGVRFLGTVYFTRRSTIEKRPGVVQAFVNALADGWKAASAQPDKAIRYLKRYDQSIDESREAQSLAKALPYFRDSSDRFLTCDYNSWSAMVQSLIDIKALKSAGFARSVDTSFIHNYYLGRK